MSKKLIKSKTKTAKRRAKSQRQKAKNVSKQEIRQAKTEAKKSNIASKNVAKQKAYAIKKVGKATGKANKAKTAKELALAGVGASVINNKFDSDEAARKAEAQSRIAASEAEKAKWDALIGNIVEGEQG